MSNQIERSFRSLSALAVTPPNEAAVYRRRLQRQRRVYAATGLSVIVLIAAALTTVAAIDRRSDGGDDRLATPIATGTVSAQPTPGAVPPSLILSVNASTLRPIVGQTVSFTVRGVGFTSEADGGIDHPVMYFGDGGRELPASIDPTCSGAPRHFTDTFPIKHTYSRAGTYHVTVSIESCGQVRSKKLTVVVLPAAR